MRLTGKIIQGESHARAAMVLEKQCSSRRLNGDGVKHLKKLLGEKSNVSYGNRRITEDEARSLSTSAERFETWAMQTLGRVS